MRDNSSKGKTKQQTDSSLSSSMDVQDTSGEIGLQSQLSSSSVSSSIDSGISRHLQPRMQSPDLSNSPPDDELLRRILSGKRASEGAIKFVPSLRCAAALYSDRRKSSLIPSDDNLLPPVTEGVMMQHEDTQAASARNSHLPATHSNESSRRKSFSQNYADSSESGSSSSSTSNLRRISLNRRNSVANDTGDSFRSRNTSCSSSMSLSESGSGSQARRSRCSSIISQCSVTSSILSENARHQLNFTLSPDLPLDCNDLYEANDCHSQRKLARFDANADDDDMSSAFNRPASPEPLSSSPSYEDYMMNSESDCRNDTSDLESPSKFESFEFNQTNNSINPQNNEKQSNPDISFQIDDPIKSKQIKPLLKKIVN